MHADLDTIMSGPHSHDLEGRVAVIGMAARLPRSRSIAAFRDNLRNGVESIRTLTEQELLDAGESLDTIRDPAYVPAAAPLEDIDLFDAGFFGMSPRDAAVFDPQHRVLLELAWEAFEHAGYVGSRINGSVGVFASCGLSEYMFKNAMSNRQIVSSVGEWLVRHTGNDTNFLATRISYELDLDGPSMNVQTACSSSLVAVHLACQSLLNGECDVALAGGAVVAPVQHRGYFYKEGEILSPDGHCRPFDARSAGTVISSAAGCVLLKPLAAALADGDNVLAVIRGSAINNDGRDKVGYLAPSVSGQARVVSEALAVAGVDARDVGYIECHGTGTLLGDPIEIAGLTTAFREYTDDTQFCAIGSLKSNIGHAGEAAGVAGLIKTVLSLHHGELYPSLHYREPNPQADLPSSPFWVNVNLRDWSADPRHPRIAGVTGLGAGGTNVHVVLEEAPVVAARPAAPAAAAPQLITVSARTESGLQRACTELAAHLRDHPGIDLADVACTRLQGRAGFKARRAVVARSVPQAAELLDSADTRSMITGTRGTSEPTVAFMMPGGGAQYASMGAGLYRSEPVYRQAIDACCAIADPLLGLRLRELMHPATDIEQASERLERPGVALPALFATGYAMARLLQSKGIQPSAMIGHSAGEYVVACLAGVMSLEDALAQVILRGRLFESLPHGGMISVQLDEREVLELLPAELSIAAVNAPGLCVVSGPVAALEAFEAVLRDRDVETMRVHIDVAAHSAMLEPILDEFAAFCRTIKFQPPQIPYVSNLTGTWATAADVTDPEYWVRHLRHTVRFGDGMAALLADGNRVLVEIGPGRALSTFARMASPAPAGITPTLRHPQELADDDEVLLSAVARMWVAGVELDPQHWFDLAARRRVPLPTYPWDRQRYWVDPDPVDAYGGTTATMRKRHDVAQWFAVPSWRPEPAAVVPGERQAGVTLVVHDGQPFASSLMGRLAAQGERVASVSFGSGFDRSSQSRFEVDPANPDDWTSVVESLKVTGGLPNRIIHMSAVGDPPRRLRRRTAADLAVHTEIVDQASLLMMLQALVLLSQPIELFVVTSGACAVGAESATQPQRAMLHGAARVVPRETTTITTQVIDIDHVSGQPGERSIDALLGEVAAPAANGVVALRDGRRWVSELQPITLPPAATSPWRHGGCYLITGGLGGIGLSIAEHIATTATAPTIVLAGRSGLPAESSWEVLVADPGTDALTRSRIDAVRRMRARGATVLIERADVSQRADVDALVQRVTSVGGSIHGVVHAAGVLDDVLIALRQADPRSQVVDVKLLGALHLVDALSSTGTEFIVLCSSVSTYLGLPGQADYTAANAALDAVAHRAGSAMRVVSVNWNTWQDVGMAAEAVRHEQTAAAGGVHSGPFVAAGSIRDGGDVVRASLPMSRASHWLLNEHVMARGDALIPGTGFLEIIREMVVLAAGESAAGPVVRLEDVVFAAPFAVAGAEVRTLEIGLDRRDQTVTLYSDTLEAPHVVATYDLIGELGAGPLPMVDVDAVRARCVRRVDRFDGYSDQPFMTFGPRWGNLFSVGFGDGEAIITTRLPAAYVGELDDLWLHPALLDMATGSAQAMIPGFDQATSFYVPFGYGRVVVHGPLPAEAVSHVRLTSGRATATAVFDIDICDPAGNVAVAITGFTMRRVDAGTPVPRRHAPDEVTSESALARALREGILPSEGVDALDRILAARLGPQVVASSVDVGAWVTEVDLEALGPAGSADSGGPQFERPDLGVAFVEPATAVEQRIATIWSELLGVATVGRDDDFFELGGQSLIAIRLMTRLQREFGVRLQLSDIFELQTLRSLAAAIEQRNPALAAESAAPAAATADAPIEITDVPWKSLVQVSAGGDGLPLFVVHGAGGNVLFLWSLAKQLQGIRPVYGFQAKGIDAADDPDPSLHHMAQRYVDELVAGHPGPYLLGGYSGGGLIAMEMAELLKAKGLEVLHVLLLDSSPNGSAPTTNGERLANVLRNIPKAGVRRMWPFLRHKLSRNYHKLIKPSARSVERRESIARELGHREFEGYVNLTAYFTDLVGHYENGRFDVDATLLKADTEWPERSFDYDWHKYNTRPVAIRYVAGDHLNMFSPEISERLGRAVREVLAPY